MLVEMMVFGFIMMCSMIGAGIIVSFLTYKIMTSERFVKKLANNCKHYTNELLRIMSED